MSDHGPYSNAAGGELASKPDAPGTVSASASAFTPASVPPLEPDTKPDAVPPTAAALPAGQAPAGQEPRDKLWVSFVWEGLLLVLVALSIAAFLLFGSLEDLGDADAIAELFAGATPFLLFAMALGLSMRVGSVNLAVVHLGLLSMTIFVALDQQPFIVAIGVVALAMAAAGVLLSLLVTVFKAPGWAASLAVAMLAWFLVSQRELNILPGDEVMISGSTLQLEALESWLIVAGTVGLSIAGGALGLIRPLRETMGSCVEVTERRRGLSVGSFFLTWAAVIGSCLLAGAAGYLVQIPAGANLNMSVMNANGLAPLLTGLGIVLIGGTSARGRRGGVFGTVLAALIVYMATIPITSFANAWIFNYVIPFGVLLLGLLVNWLLDLINSPKKPVAAGFAQPFPAMASPYAPVAPPTYAPAEPASPQSAEPVQPVASADTAPQSAAAAPPQVYTPVEPAVHTASVEPVQPVAAADTAPQSAAAAESAQPVEPAPSATPESPSAEESTQEIPADANPYLYRPPAG